ncbi:hypothetical protein RJT34_22717 [Clitoria ternatea]|uniref:Uncharacterized protein n=1 Tax=Clitoria ternatea TaxID=43366 RepID=A0AAN9IFU2_CLITE
MMDREEKVDFSCYFQFEASGDSEVDSGYACEVADDGDDNDDALSCSYDGSCSAEELDGCEMSWDEDREDEDDKKKEDFGTSYCEDDDEMQQEEQLKSYVSFDSGQNFVDEMEKNRLFWEACLAS